MRTKRRARLTSKGVPLALALAPLAACGVRGEAGPRDSTGLAGSGDGVAPCPEAPWPIVRAPDGTPAPPDVTAAYGATVDALAAAQRAGDVPGVERAACDGRVALGAWQGVAEASGDHHDTAATMPDVATARDAMIRALRGRVGREPWAVVGGSSRGEDQSEPLRASCEMARWYVVVAPVAGEAEATFLERARDGLAWLAALQRPDGFFPFPDLSGDAESFLADCAARGGTAESCEAALPRLPALARRERQRWAAAGSPPGTYVDGWLVRDQDGTGAEFLFDTGRCGQAFLSAFEQLRERSYLDVARRAGAWAAAAPASTNWNFNSFGVGLLAELARLDPEAAARGWADAALAKARLGVLPGVLPDGRWLDAHNARIVYHQIILNDLGRLAAVTDDPRVRAVRALALRRSVDEVTARGSAGLDDGIEALLLARRAGLDTAVALPRLLNDALRGTEVANGSLALWVREELAR